MQPYDWADPPSRSAFPIARPGYPFIFAAAFATIVLALIGFGALAIVGLLATLFICYFFRDPDRATPVQKNAVISPADGRVVSARVVDKNPYLEGEEGRWMKIGIFMSLFNVHVNRVPYAGIISAIKYYPGRFYSADKEIASMSNEQNAITLTTGDNQRITFVQIAGLVARRIICWVNERDPVVSGQRFGLICFGSRVDLYLPAETEVAVSAGDRVRGGATIIGYLPPGKAG